MFKFIAAAAFAAAALSACSPQTDASGKSTPEGPAASTSETPRNEAIDTAPTAGETGPTPGANSYTESQARSAIESAGYTGVGALTQNTNGLWQGKAMKDGAEVSVSVDYKGAVTAL